MSGDAGHTIVGVGGGGLLPEVGARIGGEGEGNLHGGHLIDCSKFVSRTLKEDNICLLLEGRGDHGAAMQRDDV